MTVVSFERRVIGVLCNELNTARSLGLYLHMNYSDDLTTVRWLKEGIRPESYDCATTFAKDYLINSFLSKWKGWRTGVNLAEAALASWTTSECSNERTNDRLRRAASNSRVEAILFVAMRKIAHILGDCPDSLVWTDLCQWSGGSTVDKRRGTPAPEKMSSRMTVTSGAFPWISAVLGHDPHWCKANHLDIVGPCCLLPSEFTFVKGGKFGTVPKDALTNRTIETQPTANIYLQKGIGAYMRRKLKRFGVDLDDQLKNQQLASYAERLNLATIDLKAASNSLSVKLVETLLPLDWWLLLDSLRTTFCVFDRNRAQRLEMFSSMGNGFTFELESLIFYAVATAVNESLGLADFYTAIYGDDIIVPAVAAPLLTEVLAHLGFDVNAAKSFTAGSFYESCGKHYFRGIEVTPAYQKENLDSGRNTAEVIRMHNRLYRWSMRTGVKIPKTLRLLSGQVEANTTDLVRIMSGSQNLKTRKKAKSIDVPRIPHYRADDRGLLCHPDTLVHRHSSHGYLCTTYDAVSGFRKTSEEHFLALALRASTLGYSPPDGLSTDSRGHAYVSDPKVRYRYNKAYIE
ncbi:MAG: RNA replicase beta chain [Leptochloa chinensis fiers-like virus 1]|nr:MAG: RNA replicase beta chain [Leptochloa chinensis fiers-like virus 1]